MTKEGRIDLTWVAGAIVILILLPLVATFSYRAGRQHGLHDGRRQAVAVEPDTVEAVAPGGNTVSVNGTDLTVSGVTVSVCSASGSCTPVPTDVRPRELAFHLVESQGCRVVVTVKGASE